MARPISLVPLLLLCPLLLGCPEPIEPIELEAPAECEWLIPSHCAFPWPSNRFTVEDESSATGLRVAYRSGTVPLPRNDEPFDPEAWNLLDGFSPSGNIYLAFDDVVDVSNLAGHRTIERSLAEDSPTVILDATTGERVAHWVEIDAGFEDRAEVLLYIRSAVRLREATRYVVALRELHYESGEPVALSESFRALRDDIPTTAPSIEKRRPRFEEMFSLLDSAGVKRESLLLAWDFTTASGDMLRRDMLHMREDALARVGDDGIGCTVTEVELGYADAWAKIEGTFTVPFYMDRPGSFARLVRDDDGLPEYQGMHEVPFMALVPSALAEEGARPGSLITYGHGLMGTAEEATWGGARRIAETHRAVMVATDWAGMSSSDVTAIAAACHDVSDFVFVGDRLHQGMINQLVLTRTMTGACNAAGVFDIDGTSAIDPEKSYWIGISQGGIFGAASMALSTDIQRGVLHVGGANYALMVERSSNYVVYGGLLESGYARRMDRQFLWGVMQQLWDRTDGITWLENLVQDPLPGSQPKEILYSVALNDAQVSNLSSDLAARTAGFPLMRTGIREPWGVPAVDSPVTGSAYVYFDVGDPPAPETNLTPEDDPGGHGRLRGIPEHLEMVDGFLRDGVIVNPCDGPCVFP